MTTTPHPSGPRQPTPIDAVAEAHVDAAATLNPLDATAMGLPGHEHEMTDLSPAGHDARADLARSTLVALDGLAPVDAVDEVTLAAMRERLGLELELHDAGEHLRDLNNIASPVQGLRDVFDIMATSSVEDWENVAARLNALPGAVDGYVESLRLAASRGDVAAVRQVEEAVRQALELADPQTSFFTSFVAGADVDAALDESSACALVRAELERGAVAAREAYGTLATFLRDELAPRAPQEDAVGRDRYALFSRAFLGAAVDLEETYRWGVEELARVVAEQQAVAEQIAGPGASVEQAVAALDADPARQLHGTEALRAWMQETSDAAIDALDGVHFTIPEALRTLECRIAPTQTGGIYYTGPSDDFSRPGRMWWSVPADVTTFGTWREKTTVYHEGVPGHHLQIGQAVAARDTLNRWRRLACWTSGFGEGWALYAERLMADLGFLDDPGDRFGMLDSQRLRAARVVFDIGVHLGLPAPAEWGGGTWDADKGWELLRANVNMPESSVRFEWMRYLGWPGQAPSYKVGQRLWEQTRDEAAGTARTRGEGFDLRAFHASALDLGALPLDVLKQVFATA
ncbi:DUF885 domain-containing protein [Cellulomonas fimi]|uniref:DUF885 domain-containing protein n=1 Tax=Cellulomonas fimi (strain ATCC 484 / DSM 20113 / JCM 1341 / CCUG 24087 / LMG 16345 / NBRC 15513 / NCIMB 8980 / NCTC 7547 / NRS-133) TaxID=590998 RepID=F4H804_CELFA|nr:DUF885 domain-containing protein [Cellulomonas fimi]AEE46965.1 protein of unknown function DUF885 [Cellulomonas fimi ATCC 484]VEH34710.1 Bacterial protein of uncharacterised function (DUF885) [Cellulomonas fimi]